MKFFARIYNIFVNNMVHIEESDFADLFDYDFVHSDEIEGKENIPKNNCPPSYETAVTLQINHQLEPNAFKELQYLKMEIQKSLLDVDVYLIKHVFNIIEPSNDFLCMFYVFEKTSEKETYEYVMESLYSIELKEIESDNPYDFKIRLRECIFKCTERAFDEISQFSYYVYRLLFSYDHEKAIQYVGKTDNFTQSILMNIWTLKNNDDDGEGLSIEQVYDLWISPNIINCTSFKTCLRNAFETELYFHPILFFMLLEFEGINKTLSYTNRTNGLSEKYLKYIIHSEYDELKLFDENKSTLHLANPGGFWRLKLMLDHGFNPNEIKKSFYHHYKTCDMSLHDDIIIDMMQLIETYLTNQN